MLDLEATLRRWVRREDGRPLQSSPWQEVFVSEKCLRRVYRLAAYRLGYGGAFIYILLESA